MDVNLFTSTLRIGGMATGMDTDKMVSDLMKIERMPLDRLYQQKQLAEWRQDEYRDIINLLRNIKDEYFNLIKPESYMLSQSGYKKMSAVSSDSSVVTATASTNVVPGRYKISVDTLAKAAKAESANGVTATVKNNKEISSDRIIGAGGKNITITLDGTSREITMGSYDSETTIEEMAADIQAKINVAFGEGKVRVGVEEGEEFKELSFISTGGASKIVLSNGYSNDGLQYLNIGQSSNRLDIYRTLENLSKQFGRELTFDENDNLQFSINGKDFTFSKTITLANMLNTINNDEDANVIMAYDEASDKFKITAKQTGAGETIKIFQTGGNFFSDIGDGASGINLNSPVSEDNKGRDAVVIVDGQTITRSSNNFTVNGISYTLNKEDIQGEYQIITVEADIEDMYNNIKNFVESYNNLISTINGKLSEKYNKDFPPLTQQQKDAMSDKDIERWEAKAKTGLVKNDRILESIVYDMRKALFDKVEGMDINFTSIGITTGPYYEKGQLKIDETKLKEAIMNNPDGVMNLFNKKSETVPSYNRSLSSEEQALRYNESGIAQRLFDIIENNISTIRNDQGKKGTLLEKAGIKGDASEFTNLLFDEIKMYDSRIEGLYNKLITKENRYFQQFAAMERIIGQMYTQSDWLATQFSQF